ncbi:MAG: ATP-binding cassette domain-containing protein, partial [Methylococcales bacterium]|nr:ATP-binding cassette domain-containing protein [Methylococcales bacterium]
GGDVYHALSQVGLRGYEDVPCAYLSAGQQRRVALARLYLSRAPLWILDEPFTALDKAGVGNKERLMADHARRGGVVILTTHHNLKLPDMPVRGLHLDS